MPSQAKSSQNLRSSHSYDISSYAISTTQQTIHHRSSTILYSYKSHLVIALATLQAIQQPLYLSRDMELKRIYITVYLFAASTRIFIICSVLSVFLCVPLAAAISATPIMILYVAWRRRRTAAAARFPTPIEHGSTTICVSTCTTLMKAFSSDRLSRPRAKNMHVWWRWWWWWCDGGVRRAFLVSIYSLVRWRFTIFMFPVINDCNVPLSIYFFFFRSLRLPIGISHSITSVCRVA